MKRFFHNESGLSLILFAILMPAILALVTIIVEGSLLQARYNELQGVAARAADTALLSAANIEWGEATEYYNELCESVCPQVTYATELFTDEYAIANYIKDKSMESLLKEETEKYINYFSPASASTKRTISITYPYEYIEGSRQANILVSITEESPYRFLSLLSKKSTISVSARAAVDF